jgi:hypothetical protein
MDVIVGSGSGGMVGSGGAETIDGIWGTGGFGQIDAAGGANGSGGALLVGGTTGSGGLTGTGGFPSTGGAVGSGGITGTGGAPSTGGLLGSGGLTGTGGFSSTGGVVGSGGLTGTGGTPSTGGATGSGGVVGTGGSTPPAAGPCDIYAAAGTPCVAAHSTVRPLYGSYSGNLYQVRRASDGTLLDIGILTPGGFANVAAQDSFCSGTTCTISILYDQSPNHNDLTKSPKVQWLPNGGNEAPLSAADKYTVGGHTVYGVYIVNHQGMGYRNNSTSTGLAKSDEPESMYMVVDAKRHGDGCCFDYGNASTSGMEDGNATMECIYWGDLAQLSKGFGNGPWIESDLGNGIFHGGDPNVVPTTNTPLLAPAYATLILNGSSGDHYTLKGGDAQTGKLVTKYDGARPPSYTPQKKEGAVILGTSSDGSDSCDGTFFEGCITKGVSSDAIDDLIQANIVAVGYGH